MLLWLLFVVTCIIVYVIFFKPLSYWKEKHVVHDKPWPFVGNLGKLVFQVTSFAECLEDLYNKYPNSRYLGFMQFLLPTLMLRDVELIKQIAVKDFDHFLDHRSFISEEIDPLFGRNLFALKGHQWRQMRSTLSPAFTGSKMRSMFTLMSDCAEQFTKTFLKSATQNKLIEVEMKDIFTRFANDVIATCAFGIKCDSLEEKNNEFYLMGKEASTFTGFRAFKFFGYSISPFLMKFFRIKLFDDKVAHFFRSLVNGTMITREEQGIIRPDMIHLLMEAKKGKLKSEGNEKNDKDAGFATVEEIENVENKPNFQFSDDDLVAQAVLFFFAGFDTISTLLCHIANELAINPEIQQRLQQEVDDTLAELNGKITYDSITKMKYLDMVICESLRKWPPAILSDRICNKTYTIQPTRPDELPLTLYKGDLTWIPIYAIQRDPENFPNPTKFDPERFSDENKNKIKPFTYIPFGLGPRNCIGSRLALLEAKVIFIYLLSKFDIVVTEKTQIPLRLSRSNFNMQAEKGFWLGFKVRQ